VLQVILHTGIEHPDLFWILVSSALAFGAGVAVEKYTSRATPRGDSVAETE
jgi:hypothetical protein